MTQNGTMVFNRFMSLSTADLISEYDARIAGRFTNCHIGSSRHMSRQAKIDAIVDELSNRADNGDVDAEAWYEL